MSILRHTYYAINSIFYFHLSNNSCSHSNFMIKQHHNFYLCCDFMNKQHHRFYLCHNFMNKQHCSSYFYHSFMSKCLLVYKFHHNLSIKCLKIDCLLYFYKFKCCKLIIYCIINCLWWIATTHKSTTNPIESPTLFHCIGFQEKEKKIQLFLEFSF